MADSEEAKEGTAAANTASSRRTFLKRATLAIGAAIGAAIAYPIIRYVIFPVGRRVVGSADDPIDVAAAEDLKVGADPVKVELVGEGVADAWAVSDNVALGSAWLRKREDGEVVALSATCPHLGCSIAFDGANKEFRCPCHKSAFSVEGDKKSGPAKRGLDPLPVKVEDDGRVLVTFVRYRQDIPEREPV